MLDLVLPLELSFTVNLETPEAVETGFREAEIPPLVVLPDNLGWPAPHDYRRVFAELILAYRAVDCLVALQTRALRSIETNDVTQDNWFHIDRVGRVELGPLAIQALQGQRNPWIEMPKANANVTFDVLGIELSSPARKVGRICFTVDKNLVQTVVAICSLTVAVLAYVHPSVKVETNAALTEISSTVSDKDTLPESEMFRASILNDLKEGKDQDALIKIQSHLYALGFYKGPMDGIEGPGTKKAVHDFEDKYRLSVTTNWRTESFIEKLTIVVALQYKYVHKWTSS
jgi:Putative peptidoglycan binding domain